MKPKATKGKKETTTPSRPRKKKTSTITAMGQRSRLPTTAPTALLTSATLLTDTSNAILKKIVKRYYEDYDAKRVARDKSKLSFSLLMAVEKQGCAIDLFPASNLYDGDDCHFHQCMAITLILPPFYFVLFVSDLLHNGHESRLIPGKSKEYFKDSRIFMYLQQRVNATEDGPTLRSVSSQTPSGDDIPKPKSLCPKLLCEGTCEYCVTETPTGKRVIDLSKIYTAEELNSKSEGDIVFGDLERFGFIVVKSFHDTDISDLAEDKIREQGKLHSCINKSPGRMLVYPAQRGGMELERAILNCPLHQRMAKIRELAGETIGKPLTMQKPNIIYNKGKVEQQAPHYDYKRIKKNRKEKK